MKPLEVNTLPEPQEPAEGAAARDPELEQIYAEERKELAKGALNAIEKFDQYMIALSTGALSLSILFMEKVATDPPPDTLHYIAGSWILFGVALTMVLLSYLLASHSWRAHIELFDIEYREMVGLPISPELAKRKDNRKFLASLFAGLIHAANWLGLVAFVIGVCHFVLFAYGNVLSRAQERNMVRNENLDGRKGDREEKSAPPIGPRVFPPRVAPPKVSPPKERPKPQADPKKDK